MTAEPAPPGAPGAPAAEPRPLAILLRDGTSAWLRSAQAADEAVVRALPWGDDARPRLARARIAVVAREREGGDEILGAAGLDPDEGYPSAHGIFAVAPEHLGRGIGTLLLQHAAERAHAAGLGTLVCRVVPPDERALEVLHRSGLVVAEREVPGGRELELATDPGEEGLARFEERERAATAASLVPLFRPASVALIGASRTPGSIGRTVLERLLAAGFAGAIYPVNPSAHAVGGIRAYPAVTAIPDAVDLAVIAVPAAAVPAVVDDCATKGVRALVVLSAGFAELGASGAAVQAELVARVRGHGMRMVGPNCIGVFNADPEVRLNATFGRALPPAGGVAMSSQSGAMGIAITDYAARLGIGLSTFVSVGNKADVSGNDLLQYWESDPGTNVIALYLESFGNPRKFSRIARRVGRRKPILAVKSGRTGAGSRAARSHTAALAGSDVAADALFRQAGIVRLDTLEELFDVASLLTGQPLPASNRVAIITNAGGPGILCADACEANGLTLPTLSGPTLSALRAVLPPTAGLANPIDMIASASPAQYETVAREVLLDPAVDALIAINISVGEARGEAFAGAVRRAAEHAHAAGAHKPTLSCFMSPDAPPAALRGEHATLGEQALGPIPAYRFPEAPARALARAVRYHDWRERAPGRVRAPEGVDREAARAAVAGARARAAGRWLAPADIDALLAAAGLALPASAVVATPEEAAAAAERIGFPVAAKVVSAAVVHKTDVGGVALDLAGAEQVRAACAGMASRIHALEGFLVQAMVPPGVEVMVGSTADATFGPLVGFGLGGTAVEVLRDTVFRLTPLTDVDANAMVREIRGFPLLDGHRGAPPADLAALEELLQRVAWLVDVVPEIAEMDLNPVRVFERGRGLALVDARIALRDAEDGPASA